MEDCGFTDWVRRSRERVLPMNDSKCVPRVASGWANHIEPTRDTRRATIVQSLRNQPTG